MQSFDYPPHLEEILKVKIKDLYGDAWKERTLTRPAYESLKKEMDIEVTGVAKPKGVTWAEHLQQQEYNTEADKRIAEQEEEFASQNQNEELDIDLGDIPKPPVQNKQRMPGEAQGVYHSRRMKEGKAYKKWEDKYGEAYARLQAGDIELGDEHIVSAETADPTKEQIEQESLEKLIETEGE